MDARQKSENPVEGAGQVAEQTKADSSIRLPQPDAGRNDAKVLANLKAKFALAGQAVHELADGGFLVVRPAWNGVRHCRDLYELCAFARMLGVQ